MGNIIFVKIVSRAKVIGSNKAQGSKQDNQIQLRLPMPDISILWLVELQFYCWYHQFNNE